MPLFANAERVLSEVEPCVIGVLLMRIWLARLGSKYRFFSAYLVAWLCQDLVPLLLRMPLNSNAYAFFYFCSDPILWVLYVLTVLELFSLVFQDFPGIATVGTFFVKISIPLAILLAALTSLPGMNPQGSQWVLQLFLVAQRTVVFSILFWLALVVFFLFRYHLELPRNTVLYALGYLLFFASKGIIVALALAIDLGRQELWNTALEAISLVCLTVWVFALNRSGEYARISAPIDADPGRREKLRLQFMAVNDKLAELVGSKKVK